MAPPSPPLETLAPTGGEEDCIQAATAEATVPYLPQLLSLSPMDQLWQGYGGTARDDGWAVCPGGTSMATAFCAGVYALALEQFPAYPIVDIALPAIVAKLRQLIYGSCVDVEAGVNEVGEEASAGGPDPATGAGMLNFKALQTKLKSLEPLMDLSGLDRFKPDEPIHDHDRYARREPR